MDTQNKNRIKFTFPPGQRPLQGGASLSLRGRGPSGAEPHFLTFSSAHFPTFTPAHLLACKAFTVLELLICIVILAFFVTIVATSTGKFDEDVKIAAALKDMKAIQTAIVDGVYPDLGYIPCGIDEFSTDERKTLEGLFVPTYLFLEREDFKDILDTKDKKRCVKEGYGEEGYIDPWDKYVSKGWSGPYMKGAAGSLDATYFDEVSFPENSKGQHVYLPAMLTPWAEKCEKMAREAEQEDKPELAMEYRKGKYYQLFYPQATMTNAMYEHKEVHGERYYDFVGWEPLSCIISKDTAYIVCRGVDCLPPPPEDPYIDYVDVASKLACEAQEKEKAVEKCKPCCESVESLKACVKEEHDNAYPECYEDNDPVPLEKRLSIMDPRSKYYMDIGDDLVMSVFGSVVRSPME